MKKIEAEKQIIKEHMDNLPELSWNAGLYSYTPPGFSLSRKGYETYYEMQPYNKAAFAQAIDKLPTKASGPTLLHNALYKLDPLLAGLKGRTVVFLFSDGGYTPMGIQRKPLELAQELARKYDVCFYIISTAKGAKEKQLLKAVSSINSCSRVVPFDALLGKPEYTTGVLYVVEEKVIEGEETRDKVVGVKVDDILFDYDQAGIKPDFHDELSELGGFLRNNPQAYVVLAGFADSLGSQAYNLGLSRRRAESVAGYLSGKFNVDSGRIVVQWYGEADPVASNAHESGRRQNRRVECVVSGMK
jgi:OOP family OmpA-OmpF porin